MEASRTAREEGAMNRHIIIEDNPRATRFMVAGIAVGYFLCFIIGWSCGIMWPQIIERIAK